MLGKSLIKMASSYEEVDLDDLQDCSHYLRKCCLVAPCCKKFFICRLCHDISESHTLDRYSVEEIVCIQCKLKQAVTDRCINCHIKFGHYACLVCRMFDDRDKKQFHCDKCRICRIGGEENFFHCPKCDMCLAIGIKESHKCIEKISRSDCPVCLEDMHTSRTPLLVPSCGHMIHEGCYSAMRKTGAITCPICCKSYDDAAMVWKRLDEIVGATPLDDKYKDIKMKILCRDCHKESEAQFHIVGIKCGECGSYNTCQS
ncbi:RING finger and CHY zinc finger domain-containing protein 1-like [Rhopilema esculentum]|uniref:RING finger and CHY zinc finger domain-containing protein 1-like n=1 Tax=Rhopilema esculentum TaxID=499914 RepID=UPI0031D2F697